MNVLIIPEGRFALYEFRIYKMIITKGIAATAVSGLSHFL